MVLTNFENAFSRNNNDSNIVLQTSAITQTTIHQQQQQVEDNFLLRQQKIDYFNYHNTTDQITSISSSPEMNTNLIVSDDNKPVCFSNGYYGFVANNIQPQNNDELKFNNDATKTLTVNINPEITNMEVVMQTNDEKSFFSTKMNGNFADKRKYDDNFGNNNYPGEMKRCRIEEEERIDGGFILFLI